MSASDHGIGAAYRYITDQLQAISASSGGNLYLYPDGHPFQLTWAGMETTQRNVVALIQGQDTSAGTILVGAHYDSVSLNPEDGAAYAPGADDNASGVAALIELVRILSARRPRATIMFVAFSAEEVGRQGSVAFIRDYLLTRDDIQLNAMISLDILGSQTSASGAVDDRHLRLFSALPDTSPSRQLARGIELLGFNLTPNMEIIVESQIDRDGRYSDHISFSDAGYPAVRFIEAAEEPNRQHTERDTIDDVQASYLTRATQTILALVTALADGPRPPRNIALRTADNGLRTLVWEPVAGAVSYVVALRRPNAPLYRPQFETPSTSVTWDQFVPVQFAGLVIMARDANGLLGPASAEFPITT
jgi:hypothetical protein